MSLNTTKQIKSVTYNGTEIPLAGGSSSSGETATVQISTLGGLERICALMYQTLNNKAIYNVEHDTTEAFTLNDILLNGIICFFNDPATEPNYLAFDSASSYGIEVLSTNNSVSADGDPGYRMFKVIEKNARLIFKLISN